MNKTYIAHLPERYIEKRSDGEEWFQMPINVSGHELMIKTVIPLTPYTDLDMEQVRKEAYDKGYQDATVKISSDEQAIAEKAYQRGLNNAWEAVRWLAKSNAGINFKIFGRHFTNEIVQEISASEAIEKIKAYEQEQEQIRVGDEVYVEKLQGKAVVMQTGKIMCCTFQNGDTFTPHMKDCKKTGRHFPEIAEVLKRMQEETT